MQKAKRVLEIGMFTGYVTLAMAEALPEDGAVVTCEYEPYLVETVRKWFDETPFGKRIDIRQGQLEDMVVLSSISPGYYLPWQAFHPVRCLRWENERTKHNSFSILK